MYNKQGLPRTSRSTATPSRGRSSHPWPGYTTNHHSSSPCLHSLDGVSVRSANRSHSSSSCSRISKQKISRHGSEDTQDKTSGVNRYTPPKIAPGGAHRVATERWAKERQGQPRTLPVPFKVKLHRTIRAGGGIVTETAAHNNTQLRFLGFRWRNDETEQDDIIHLFPTSNYYCGTATIRTPTCVAATAPQ